MTDQPKGFSYTISDEKLARYQKTTLEERMEWLYQHMKFLRAVQTREERIRMYRAKGGKNLDYYEKHGFPEEI